MMDAMLTTGMLRTLAPDPVFRADRWYQQAPGSDSSSNSGDFAGIRINIWNRARVRRFLIHNLAGGGSHNLCIHMGNYTA